MAFLPSQHTSNKFIHFPTFLQCSFFSDGLGRKKIGHCLVSFFFPLVDILAGTATVCSNSFVVVMYIYILSMASAVCPFGFYISLLVPFSFLLPYLSFFFFLYFLLLLLIFKKTKLSNYIYVFSSLILYT